MDDRATRHDPMALAGAECAGCTATGGTGYLVIGAAGPGVAACGHYIAEHATPDYYTAEQLVTDVLRAGRAAYVALYAPSGALVHSRDRGAPHAGPFSREPIAGHACPACGDSWDRWIAA